MADLPDTLAGVSSVEVAGDTEYGAAWGDPPIVLTCGVGAVDLAEAPPCLAVDGVGWVVLEGDDETTFAADGYRPRLRVVVPDDYAPEGGVLTGLTESVTSHLRLEDECV